MTRVAIITNSLTGGGAERSMNLLANEFFNLGFDVTLIPIHVGEMDQVTLNCNVVNLSTGSSKSIVGILRKLRGLHFALVSIRPEIILVNCELPELLVTLQPGRFKIICVEHSDNSWVGRSLLGKSVRFILNLRRAQWVVVSQKLQVRFLPKVKIIHIPNPISEKIRKENFDFQENVSSSASRLIFVGRLSKEKRPMLFLDLCKKFNLPGLVIGDGVQRIELEIYAKAKDISVRFLGHQKNPWDEVKRGDLVVIPSSYEGDGRVLAEAFVLGFPLLVSDIPAFREYKLPEFSFVKNFDELTIEDLLNLRNFQSSKIESLRLRNSRDPITVALAWRDLLFGFSKKH